MSKRAEEAALKAYPYNRAISPNDVEYDGNFCNRLPYTEGYEQAEQDIISIIESRISEILGDAQPKPALRAELQELIKRIKEGRIMKIEVTIIASGNTEKARETLTEVVKDIRAGLFQAEASSDDVKVKATVKVMEED